MPTALQRGQEKDQIRKGTDLCWLQGRKDRFVSGKNIHQVHTTQIQKRWVTRWSFSSETRRPFHCHRCRVSWHRLCAPSIARHIYSRAFSFALDHRNHGVLIQSIIKERILELNEFADFI
ncbi:hypothetical protein CEXT_528681 [Caerostris extrusa]|uniref:Uncharacterized protein n=1 Tax=Caerostris extrusa TaxID=172846 RepID=A0AAV4N8H6_CAEEX|nr:hypothetical protein CEXT_528681 [Caerostris extrusa]